MTDYKNKKFIASYSCGKDSTLAIYRAIKMGIQPMELITTYNQDKNRSWFHSIPQPLLQRLSQEINIPISLIVTTGATYAADFEAKLRSASEQGAEICVFGDIDVAEHLAWCTDRCSAAGLTAYFPLWQEERKKLVYEFIDLGFKTIITIIDNKRMPEKFLGCILTREIADEIEKCGADICGENGEYHTFTFAGPLFSLPVAYKVGTKMLQDNYSILPIS
ncbi:MAG: diphthine--ammonia ligase [Clostridia bacterium]